jgi:hypothetical protein
VASRIATELILEHNFMFRPIGVELDRPAVMFGDNMSVILHTHVPSIVLKKNHNALANFT